MSSKDITSIINDMITKYIQMFPLDYNNKKRTPYSINMGYCYDFAEDVLNEMGLPYDGYTGSTEDYWTMDGSDSFSFSSLKKIDKELPPKGLKITRKLCIDLGRATHAWINYQGRHYDAECPEGVEKVLDLPIFKRIIDYYTEHQSPSLGENTLSLSTLLNL